LTPAERSPGTSAVDADAVAAAVVDVAVTRSNDWRPIWDAAGPEPGLDDEVA